VREVAENVYRLGSAIVNFFAVVEGTHVTIVDAGAPGYRPQVDELLNGLGRRIGDIEAILLTHAHPDHVGAAEMLRRDAGAPVYIHAGDETLATTGKATGKNEGPMLPYLRYPAAWRLLVELGRNGARKPRPIAEVTTFADDDRLDVPGRPRVVHTPGHTDGHCCLVFPESNAVFVGDALCTYNPLTGDTRGPQLLPRSLTRNVDQALRSLDVIGAIDAENVLGGHGEPWTRGAAAAADEPRRPGPT
jgi:glyoxylase-like metal-dependent hydrolase (beta-lactamase superfamily II)